MMRNVLKVAGTTYYGASNQVTTSYVYDSDTFVIAGLTASDINSMQSGIELRDNGVWPGCDHHYVKSNITITGHNSYRRPTYAAERINYENLPYKSIMVLVAKGVNDLT
jgi:hypothetical protein